MAHHIRYLSASLLVLALIPACGQRAEDSGDETRKAADQAALSDPAIAQEGVDANQALTPSLPDLIPPQPGEPGGLPDDRRPLDESPIDPASIRGAGSTLEKYALALESKDFDSAYALWRDGGKVSGITKSEFAKTYDKYLTINVLIGRPEAGGTQTARVPVQVYGRLKNSNNEPYNMVGPVILARTGNKALPWAIVDSALKPRGVVREDKKEAEENSGNSKAVIPLKFRGKWADRPELCNSDAAEMNMQIGAGKLEFWESQAAVKSVQQNGQKITITADYRGEGETWTRTTSYTLSADGGTLTSDDGTSRVKCK